ncbi:MAG: hypothetical protein LBI10_08765 [Deltaproteobacteria bacterium]|jgi:hypothetical protein|nr:hypothetical protein [Deltaproteobacteria bacterium]
MGNFYRPSGFFDAKCFIYVPLAMMVVSFLLAVPYARLLWYCPIVYLAFIPTLAFGLLASLGSQWSIKKTRVRSPHLARTLGLIGAIPSFYLSWAAWGVLVKNASDQPGTLDLGFKVFSVIESSVSYRQTLVQAFSPMELFATIKKIGPVGLWSVEGYDVHGLFLYLAWLLEAVLFFIVVAKVFTKAGGVPFSERIYKWYPKIKITSLLSLPSNLSVDKAFEAIKAGRIGALLEAREEKSPEKASYFTVDVYYLPKATEAYATVYGHASRPSGRGHKKSLLAKYVKIPETLAKTLNDRFK